LQSESQIATKRSNKVT